MDRSHCREQEHRGPRDRRRVAAVREDGTGDRVRLGGSARSLDETLREWWRWRDEDAWEMYWFAHDMGAAGPVLTVGVSRILNRDVRPSEVFPPSFSRATIEHALRRGGGQRRAIVREAAALAVNEVRRRRARRALAAGWRDQKALPGEAA